MKTLIRILTLALLAAAPAVLAAPGSALLEERYQAALNDMVREVEKAPDPEAKREVLAHFIDHMSRGLQKAESMESISEADRASLHAVLGKFLAYGAELNGGSGYERVADADLDGFAGYIQQGMEQAPMGGGVYISGGALIVILLLLIFFL